ncbi:MAG: alpha/beta fold hydrolase [Phycisphaerae bacterium]
MSAFLRRLRKRRLIIVVFILSLPTCRATSGNDTLHVDYATRRAVALPTEPARLLSYLQSEIAASDSRLSEEKRGESRGIVRVIYVHGTPGSAKQWKHYLSRPVAGTISVAPDRLGFGGSANAPDMHAVPSFAAQATSLAPLLRDETYGNPMRTEILDSRGTSVPRQRIKNILVGHSLGGPIVAWMAADYPDLVDAIVIISGSLDPDLESPQWYNRVAAFPFVHMLLPRALAISNDEILAAPRETALLREKITHVRCPVFILHGEKDSLVPIGNVAFMRASFVNAAHVEAEVLAGADHFIIWTDAARVRTIIQKCVDQILAASSAGSHAPRR